MITPPGRVVDSPEEALRRARVIWAALLMGQILFLGVVGFVFSRRDTVRESGELSLLLTRIGLVLLLLVVPLAYVVRRRIFRGRVEGQPTSPASYVQGMTVFLSMCEFVSLFSLVATYLHGRFFPPAITTLVSMIVQAINLPDGREMRPSEALSGSIEPR